MASVPKSIKASLYIDGKPAESSLRNIRQATGTLRREFDNLTVGTEAWKKKLADLQAHERTLANINREVRRTGESFGWLTGEVGKLGKLALGYLGFNFITDQFQGIIANNAKLSDSLANVRRTANLSEAGVRGLFNELNKIDTRTSQSDLLKIAEIGGQFNVPTEQMKGFVTQIDRANVVLGSEFKGGAEQITTQLALLRNVFTDIKSDRIDEDLGHIGNALIVLAQKGAATAPIVSEMANRLAPLEATAKLSSAAVLGLSATLQELGVKPEAGASAVLRLFDKMISNANEFAKVAGMSNEGFKKLLEDDAMGAFTKVLEGFKKGGDNVSILNKTVEELEVSGVNAKGALVKLSENTEMLTGRVTLAADALTNTDAITKQYNISNDNMAGSLEKLGKKFTGLSTNTQLIDIFQRLIILASKSIDFFIEHGKAIGVFAKVLITAAIAWAAYRLATALATSEKLKFIFVTNTARIQTIALAAVQAIMTRDLAKLTQAYRLLTVTMGLSPWGLAIAGVTALVAAFVVFSSSVTNAAKIQENFNEIQSSATKAAAEEKNKIEALLVIMNSEKSSREQKLKAINKLMEIMPAHLAGYTKEEILAGKAKDQILEYVKALETKAKAEATGKKLAEIDGSIADLEAKQKNGFMSASFTEKLGIGFQQKKGENQHQAFKRIIGEQINELKIQKDEIQKQYVTETEKLLSTQVSTDPAAVSGKTLDGLEKKLEELKEKRKFITLGTKEYAEATREILATQAELDKYSDSKNKSLGKKAETEAQRDKKQALAEFEKLDDQYKKLDLQRLDDQLSANEKEVAQEENKYNALIEKEQEFLLKKGITAEQAEATKEAIRNLEINRDKAVIDLRVRQETEMADRITDLRTKLADVHESELVKQKDQINKFYDEQERKVAGNEKALAILKYAREQETGDAELREKERLEKEKLDIESKYAALSDNKKENKLALINKKYDDELEALKQKFSKEIQLTQQFKDAVNAIENNRKAELNFQERADLEEKRDFQIQVAQQAADATFSIITSNQKAASDRKISVLESEREKELSNKNLTEAQKSAINEKFDRKVAAEKEKAWEAERAAAVAQALINGALAVTKVLAQTGVLSPFAIPAIVAGTSLQIATILGQPKPKFAAGGFSDQDPAGFVDQSTVFSRSASGRPFEAGEKGREWIAPNWMVKSPRFANVIGMLETARREKRSFASGGFNDNGSAPAVAQSYDFTRLEGMMSSMMAAIAASDRKPVVLSYAHFEDYKEKIDRVRMDQTG